MAGSVIKWITGATPGTPGTGVRQFFNSSKNLSTIDSAGLVLDYVLGRAVASSAPADPTGTTDTTGKMMGLAGSFTPGHSGRVALLITGNIAQTTTADGAVVQLTYGTGSAPANAGALTGTATGSAISMTFLTGVLLVPFMVAALPTGLTLGTAYWFDARLKAVTGGTASIKNLYMIAAEI
jgi:hypothetical protein